MPILRARLISYLVLFSALLTGALAAQTTKASLTGTVKDVSGAQLQGARINLEPAAQPTTSNGQGAFFYSNLTPGDYTVTISAVGFETYSTQITLSPGQGAHLDAFLKVGSTNDSVVVTAERPRGEAEAINRTLAAENILQVLPAEVITSLPNANMADALGRMASVTIERDEGEGKYVQIRGTEPRLSNTMVDGVTVPSPESGVRQIKLDTIASDLVDSVEINKTLQANIDADGIGGSVNLVTRTASEAPTVSIYGLGGYTPISGGRKVDQFGATLGKRFGGAKKLGTIVGGTYDYNGRAINDIEPSPTADSATPHYDSIDLRDYIYYRTRYGFAGSADYKLGEGSDISVRGLYSTFRNWGNKWVFTLNDGGKPGYSQDWRRPNMALGSLSVQGRHLFGSNTFLWTVAAGRSRSLSGSGFVRFKWAGDPNIDCTNDQSRAASKYRPGWSAGCFGSGVGNAEDSANYSLTSWAPPTFGKSAQVNLQASASYARMYRVGSHYGTVEVGGKIRNAHKFDDTYNESFKPVTNMQVSQHPEWNSNFTDKGYYDKTYRYGPVTDYAKIDAYVHSNSTLFTQSGGPGVNSHNYDLIERIPAGYVMNTIEVTPRVRLVAGVRFEATHVDTISFNKNTNALDFKGGGDYTDVLPSASVRFAIDKDSDLRVVYGRGLARPNPQELTASLGQPDVSSGKTYISAGNPNLKAEHANNYDILYERNLNHVGLIQAGYFYKDLSDPITTVLTHPTSGPLAGDYVTQPGNAGSAHVQGIELGYQQRLSYLPGVMSGAGISANYSYTASQADGIPGRSDHPALLRQAPNSWNVSPTYDARGFSMRAGLTFDDKMIYQYQWADGADSVGVKGPLGDNYLYSHLQFDTQASYRLPGGFEVYGYALNLNNEVFGFYNGSPQYVVQREYYHPSYAGGLRWNLAPRER